MSTLIEVPPEVETRREQIVREEAERLDRLFPGWEENVNVHTLYLRSGDHCVIGQGVPGLSYAEAFDMVCDDGYESQHGLGSPYVINEIYRDYWVREILARRVR